MMCYYLDGVSERGFHWHGWISFACWRTMRWPVRSTILPKPFNNRLRLSMLSFGSVRDQIHCLSLSRSITREWSSLLWPALRFGHMSAPSTVFPPLLRFSSFLFLLTSLTLSLSHFLPWLEIVRGIRLDVSPRTLAPSSGSLSQLLLLFLVGVFLFADCFVSLRSRIQSLGRWAGRKTRRCGRSR